MSFQSLDPFAIDYISSNSPSVSPVVPQNPEPLLNSSSHNSSRKRRRPPQNCVETPPIPFTHLFSSPTNLHATSETSEVTTPVYAQSNAAKRRHSRANSENIFVSVTPAASSSRKRQKRLQEPPVAPIGVPVPVFAPAVGFTPGQSFQMPSNAATQVFSYPTHSITPPTRPKYPALSSSLAARMQDPHISPLIRKTYRPLTVEVEVVIPPGNMKEQRTVVYTSVQQKLDSLFWFLDRELGWTYGQMLWYTAHKEGPGLTTDNQSSSFMHFLRGHDGTCWPSSLVDVWFWHPAGREKESDYALYSFEPSFKTIRPVRAGLSAFAAQLVEQKLSQEAESACRAKELRVKLSTRSKRAEEPMKWDDTGEGMQEFLRQFYVSRQPVGWRLVKSMAMRKKNGVFAVRQRRPIDPVSYLL